MILNLDRKGYEKSKTQFSYHSKIDCYYKKPWLPCIHCIILIRILTEFYFCIIQVQTIVSEIPMIQIAYGASSTTLSDRETFPFLLRPNPSDAIQMEYVAQLIQQLRNRGNEINAVNIIYSNSLYGKDGYEVWPITSRTKQTLKYSIIMSPLHNSSVYRLLLPNTCICSWVVA